MIFTTDLAELLVQAGAQLRGRKRADCPRCGGHRTISYTVEVFHCHKCTWAGNAITLGRELGLFIAKPSAREISKRRLVKNEAVRFTEWARRRRIATAALLRTLNSAEAEWREIGRAELASGRTVSEIVWKRLQLCILWSERAEQVWWRLLNFESNAGELYREFSQERRETA